MEFYVGDYLPGFSIFHSAVISELRFSTVKPLTFSTRIYEEKQEV
jgi:hypothetical protein